MNFNNMIRYIYPIIGISTIEGLEKIITHAGVLLAAIIFLVQFIIGFLTVYRLWYDIKYHKYKSIEKSTISVKKKHPFLFALTEFLKTKK